MRPMDGFIAIGQFTCRRARATIHLEAVPIPAHPPAYGDKTPMTRPALSLLAASLGLFAIQVQAQSSVTVSGILDLAVRQVNNEGVGSLKSMVSGSNSTSRIIVSGREDLGDGMFAGFHLEHGITADTGSQTVSDKFWDRRSTVSVGSKAWGEIRAGRDFVPSYTNWSAFDPFAYVGAARSANLVSATPTGPIRSAFGTNANTTVRSDNAVQWLLPAGLGGIEGGVMLAAGEGGDATAGRAKLIGIRLGYAAANWSVSAASTESKNSLTGTSSFTDRAIGGSYTVAGIRFTAAQRTFKQALSKQTLTMLGALYTSGPHELKASVVSANMAGRVGTTVIDANDARQIGLGYGYNLSRRTQLYGIVSQLSNDGAARFVITDGRAGLIAGGTSKGIEAGIRHRF